MRSVWFVAGAGAGVYAVVRARRAAEALTPEGWHDRLAGLRLGWHLFADEVRVGMTEKETELRERLVFGLDGPAALPPGTSAGQADGPAARHRAVTGPQTEERDRS